MFFPVTFEGMEKSCENHRHHHYREDDVRDENDQIESFNPSEIGEFCAAMVVMIKKITDEKYCREKQRWDHAFFVTLNIFVPDESITCHKANGGE